MLIGINYVGQQWALPTVIALVGNAHPTNFVSLTWVPQLNTGQVRARPSGEKCGLATTSKIARVHPHVNQDARGIAERNNRCPFQVHVLYTHHL